MLNFCWLVSVPRSEILPAFGAVFLSRMALRRCPLLLGVHRTGYTAPQSLPVPCAQRWDLRLARARLWDEHIDTDERAAWQLEDERHMSPEFSTFIGFPMRAMKPGTESLNRPEQIIRRRLPNQTHYDLRARRDVPFQQNVMMGKSLYDRTIHGFDVPYPYAMFKSLRKAYRNDRTLKQNKFRVLQASGVKNPPPLFQPIPDATDGDDDEKK
jgi:hypothetical protein